MSQPIWYDSTEAGAPTLNNVAGSLLEVLRACLINGFNAKPVTSIAVASGVATATCAAHGFLDTYGKLVQISGATEPLLNGNKQPGGVLTNSFTFPAPGVADGTYTGTISARRAPLGWVEAHTGTNVAMFARSVPEATAMLLRVNDSHSGGSTSSAARVLMVESATGVDSFSGRAPTEGLLSAGLIWPKSFAGASPSKWGLVGDSRFFWLFLPMDDVSGYLNTVYFGDIVPYVTPDAYGCGVCGAVDSSYTTNGGGVNPFTSISLGLYELSARFSDGSVVGVRAGKHGPSVSHIGSGGQSVLSPVAISKPVYYSNSNLSVRGEVPGLAIPLSNQPFAALGQFSVVEANAGDPERFLSVLTVPSTATPTRGNLLISLSGEWFA